MMAQVNAGRVRFVGRGEYNNSTQYYVFDLVSYNGNSYYAKVDTIGHLPTDTTYWQLVAEKGNVGPTGLTGNGISSIAKTSTSGLVDTYTITYTNGNTTTFDVSNGNGIDRIEKTATVGNKDTYTIYFTNGSTTTYEVTNGEVTREELEEEVDRLSMIYNAFPSTTGEVEEGSINGTAEVPFKEIGLKGNTSQESTTGKNLANIKNIPNQTGQPTLTVANDTISISNSPSSIGYTSTNIKLSDLCPNLQVGDTVYLFYNTTSSSSQKTIIYLSGANVSWAYNGGSKTITQEMLDSTVILYGGKDETAIISNFMITKTNDSTYEPYTGGNPAPNPDYPYPVNVVTGDNEVKVEGKNLFSGYTKGIGINGTTGAETADANAGASDYIPLHVTDDNKYIIWGLPTTIRSFVAGYNSKKEFLGRTVGVPLGEFTLAPQFFVGGTPQGTGDIEYIRVHSYKISTSTGTINDIDNAKVMLEAGTTATSYEPYQSQTYSINLGSMELCKIGDYEDSFIRNSGKNLLDKVNNLFQGSYGTTTGGDNSVISTPLRCCTKKIDLSNITGSLTFTGNYFELYNFYDAEDNLVSSVSTVTTTIPENAKSVRLRFYNNNQNLSLETLQGLNLMLANSSVVTEYEPYGSGEWYLKKNIGKVVLDGTQTISYELVSGYDAFKYNATDMFETNIGIGLSNFYQNTTPTGDGRMRLGWGNTFMYFFNNTSRFSSSVENFKTWLSTHNLIVYYRLATPTITPITDTTLIEQLDNLEKAYSYDTQTNISQTNQDKPFIISYEAILSLRNILNS